MTLIQIRGTSGSGKSTAMRSVMGYLDNWISHYEPGRKKPLYYQLKYPVNTLVLGHYESPCGGCDTIGSAPQVFSVCRSLGTKFKHVLCEGLLLSEDTKHILAYHREVSADVKILFLVTGQAECLTKIQKRRDMNGQTKPLDPTNTVNRIQVIERARRKLTAAGIHCRRASCSQAPRIIQSWIGV